jgi:hypothetical protein
MANRVFDCGVIRSAAADIIAYPTFTEIGVPTEGLATAINDGSRTVKRRLNTYPAARTRTQLGIGVPYNPHNGVISN